MGAAQEVLGMLNKKHKVRLGAAVLKWLQMFRTALLFAVLIAMIIGIAFSFADFEAFTVFHPSTAPMAALVIGAVSLLAALWIPRPWCRFLCPLGELLETLRREKSK
jgi:polyferredoxin